MPDRVVVRVPATVANLGPGFDCLGIALAWYDEVRIERHDGPVEVTAAGAGAESIPRDESNLTVVAMRALLGEVPRVRVHKLGSIAYGRGFGSSAAAIVAGLVGARALGATDHDDGALLALATEIEGHGDNVAPCLLGGITVSAGGQVLRLEPPAKIRALICVAPTRMSTRSARGVLPDPVARADAVANVGRAALLAAALATGRADILLEATEDRLHQPARFDLMPDTAALVAALRGEGIAAFLSGAGPSVTALVPSDRAPDAEEAARHAVPQGWEVRLEGFDLAGASILDAR